jgi:hypothetical protein
MITLDDWITSSGKYPDRAKSEELTDVVKDNATLLLESVNDLLSVLGVDLSKITVSSGFRPSSINSTIPHAAKRSLHMTGLAIDISDVGGELDKLITANSELLETYQLWQEHPDNTGTWCHLDKGSRSARKVRVFKP